MKLTYQNEVRIPEYFWFDPFNPDDLAGFRLGNGTYQQIVIAMEALPSEISCSL